MRVAHATNAPSPYHPRKTNNRKRHIRPFICTSSSSLPSFHPAITVTCSPPCKMQVYSQLELRDHMLHPHQQRARWSDNATTTFVSTSDDYESSSHTRDMQRKNAGSKSHHTTRTSIQQTQEIIQAPTIVTVMKNPPEPQARRNTKDNKAADPCEQESKNSARLCNKVHTRNEADQKRRQKSDIKDLISVAASVGGC
jgi:hypothetical protein